METTTVVSRYRATFILAILLLLLGAAAGYGAMRLSRIISLQERADATAAICASLKSQKYDALAALIDPAPVPPQVTGAFDRAAFLAQLQALDQHQGTVDGCSWRETQSDENGATYVYTLHRQKNPKAIGMLVILVHEPDDGWRISRRSQFTSTPV
jgi:hypothetical protein